MATTFLQGDEVDKLIMARMLTLGGLTILAADDKDATDEDFEDTGLWARVNAAMLRHGKRSADADTDVADGELLVEVEADEGYVETNGTRALQQALSAVANHLGERTLINADKTIAVHVGEPTLRHARDPSVPRGAMAGAVVFPLYAQQTTGAPAPLPSASP